MRPRVERASRCASSSSSFAKSRFARAKERRRHLAEGGLFRAQLFEISGRKRACSPALKRCAQGGNPLRAGQLSKEREDVPRLPAYESSEDLSLYAQRARYQPKEETRERGLRRRSRSASPSASTSTEILESTKASSRQLRNESAESGCRNQMQHVPHSPRCESVGSEPVEMQMVGARSSRQSSEARCSAIAADPEWWRSRDQRTFAQEPRQTSGELGEVRRGGRIQMSERRGAKPIMRGGRDQRSNGTRWRA